MVRTLLVLSVRTADHGFVIVQNGLESRICQYLAHGIVLLATIVHQSSTLALRRVCLPPEAANTEAPFDDSPRSTLGSCLVVLATCASGPAFLDRRARESCRAVPRQDIVLGQRAVAFPHHRDRLTFFSVITYASSRDKYSQYPNCVLFALASAIPDVCHAGGKYESASHAKAWNRSLYRFARRESTAEPLRTRAYT